MCSYYTSHFKEKKNTEKCDVFNCSCLTLKNHTFQLSDLLKDYWNNPLMSYIS